MEKAVIWGAAQTPPNLVSDIEKKYEIVGWVDKNESIHHQYLAGKKVYSPDEMNTLFFDKVILGAASCRASRQIWIECLSRGIKSEDVITNYVMQTQKIALRNIFVLQHKVGKECRFENYNRFNLLVQYAFAGQYFGKNTIGYDLADRYMKLVCQGSERADRAFEYFVKLIEDIEKNGFSKESFLSLNKAGWLIDGTHRMAVLLYKKSFYAEFDILNTNWNVGDNGERSLEWICEKAFSKVEINYLRNVYEEIAEYLNINEAVVRRQVDLWEKDKIW